MAVDVRRDHRSEKHVQVEGAQPCSLPQGRKPLIEAVG